MKIIFGTTSKRKMRDFMNLISSLKLDIEVLSLDDIGWDLGDIKENGSTLEENSLIKAKAIYNFCNSKGIYYPIITDDSGLFVDSLGGAPGIHSGRYVRDELKKNPDLPPHYGIIKLLKELENKDNRDAKVRTVVTCMLPDGNYFQQYGESLGTIANDVVGELKKPYFDCLFVFSDYSKIFDELSYDELKETNRYSALIKVLKKIDR